MYRKSKDGTTWQSYPCGQCIACRLNKVRDWTLRLMHEAKFYDKMVFLTITYDEEHLPEGRTLVKEDLQDYLKRLRYYCGKVRFFACGEYGDQYQRPHYHLIVYGIDKDNQIFHGKKYDAKRGIWYVKSRVWKNGTTYIGDVTYNSCRYVASYVNKKVLGKGSKEFYEKRGVIPEFTLMSRKPGIGSDFVNFYRAGLIRKPVIIWQGKKLGLPRYYEDKVFNTEALKLQRKAEKRKFMHGIDEGEQGEMQRDLNYKAKYSFRERNFEQMSKDFEADNILAVRSCSNC